jgi:formate hydrogenlyase subunit 4
MAAAGDYTLVALLSGFIAFALKVGALGFLLAAIESSFAKLRIFQAPYLLSFASVLGLLAILATYVVAR